MARPICTTPVPSCSMRPLTSTDITNIASSSASCTEAPYPAECATATDATPWINLAFRCFGVHAFGTQAALLSLMLYESGSFKYNINQYPGVPGQGTRNMQSPGFNLKYAQWLAVNMTDSGISIQQVQKAEEEGPVEVLALVNGDRWSFASAAWFLTTQCDEEISQGLAASTEEGWEAYLTQCNAILQHEERPKAIGTSANEEGTSDEAFVADQNDTGLVTPGVDIIGSKLKRKRIDSVGSPTPREGLSKRQRGEKVGCLKVGTYSAMFEQRDLGESFTLHLLANSNAELATGDEDIWRVRNEKMPTARLSTDRFTEANLHTAWLFLRNGKQPNMSTYSIDQKWNVGKKFGELSKIFPDNGQLGPLESLEPEILRKSIQAPEEECRMTEYAAWLKVLKAYDPEMMRLREDMIEATENDFPGLATDLSELEVLGPVWLYDYHLGVGASVDVDAGLQEVVREETQI
ncbi:hypothetical protein QM012_001292 [Aureobasidium pullulans]|uniref:Uncharacterized protein n=1 Tax=Aureobasidium pullulans TaxID=5580 RepID=A0ABR0TEF2_AURPU